MVSSRLHSDDFERSNNFTEHIYRNIRWFTFPISAPENERGCRGIPAPLLYRNSSKTALNSARYNKYALHIFTSTLGRVYGLRAPVVVWRQRRDAFGKLDGISISRHYFAISLKHQVALSITGLAQLRATQN